MSWGSPVIVQMSWVQWYVRVGEFSSVFDGPITAHALSRGGSNKENQSDIQAMLHLFLPDRCYGKTADFRKMDL